jgi:hypothetical protein
MARLELIDKCWEDMKAGTIPPSLLFSLVIVVIKEWRRGWRSLPSLTCKNVYYPTYKKPAPQSLHVLTFVFRQYTTLILFY